MQQALAIAVDEQTLPSLVTQAAAALAGATSAAQVLAAGEAATLVYDAAKRAARLQRAKGAHDELVAATWRVQADALEIESMAARRLADEYTSAQQRGDVAGKGKPVNVPDGNNKATAADIGLSGKQIFEARRLKAAIEQDPGIVRRALDEMLASGDEPTRAALKRSLGLDRANLRAAIGTDSASAAERGNNLYETPAEAVRTLLSMTRFSAKMWEPACGKGAIARLLEDAGYAVELSDLVDYGTADRHGECQRVEDFLETAARRDDQDRPDIVTNPPYGADLNAFVAHALAAHRPRKMALLLNLNFICGFDDPDRNFCMDDNPPADIYVFTRRLPMMHRDGWTGPEASSRMNTAWFVWTLDAATGTYDAAGKRGTQLLRVDWKTFQNSKLIGPDGQVSSPPAGGRGGEGEARNGEEGAAKTRGFADALGDWTELRELEARSGALTGEEAARLAELAPVVAADLAAPSPSPAATPLPPEGGEEPAPGDAAPARKPGRPAKKAVPA